MGALGLAGLIALAFGLGSYYATGELGRFGQANLVAGTLALLAAAVGALRSVRGMGTPLARRILATRALGLIGVLALGVGLERGADALGWRFDWTLDQRYTLSPATREALEALPDGVRATLYYDPGDPRVRSTRLLLDTFAATDELEVQERLLDDAAEAIDRFGIASSNSVVVEVDGRWELVGRPTEGSLWEALERLRRDRRQEVVYFSRGAGEGDLLDESDRGFSGLAVALQTEGYRVRDLVLAAHQSIPEDAAAVLVISPERPLRDQSLALLDAYLERGGGLVSLVDPGEGEGLVELLERWGFSLPDAVVVDAASGPIEGGAPGVNPLLHAFSDHAITRVLGSNRMAFFVQTRPVEVQRKPRPDDDLSSLVFSSRRAWLSRQIQAIARGATPTDQNGARPTRYPLMSVGRYPREGGQARIAAFGDSDFASNAYLRSLYNLDLIMNSIHWVADRTDAGITQRPNLLTVVQRPLTPQESLAMFYGAGLLLPEALLILAGVTWLRRRSA